MAWNYENTEALMKFVLTKKLISEDDAYYIATSLKREYENVPGEVSMHFEDLFWMNKFGVCGLLGEVSKLTQFDYYTAKKMAEVRTICKKILTTIKESKDFDNEYSVWEEE
jgi:hypothetical protein